VGWGFCLDALVAGKTVTVTWDKRDRNGRIIGWLMVDDGIWVNKVMVLTGYAWWFQKYASDEDQLRVAQEAAKEKRLGLWAGVDAVAPWDWRKGVRKAVKADLHEQVTVITGRFRCPRDFCHFFGGFCLRTSFYQMRS